MQNIYKFIVTTSHNTGVVCSGKKAEIIIKYHRPDSNFDQMTGVCFSAIKAKVGAATARGMAMTEGLVLR